MLLLGSITSVSTSPVTSTVGVKSDMAYLLDGKGSPKKVKRVEDDKRAEVGLDDDEVYDAQLKLRAHNLLRQKR